MWQLCPIHLAVETLMHLQMNFINYNAYFVFSWTKSISKGTQLICELTGGNTISGTFSFYTVKTQFLEKVSSSNVLELN